MKSVCREREREREEVGGLFEIAVAEPTSLAQQVLRDCGQRRRLERAIERPSSVRQYQFD